MEAYLDDVINGGRYIEYLLVFPFFFFPLLAFRRYGFFIKLITGAWLFYMLSVYYHAQRIDIGCLFSITFLYLFRDYIAFYWNRFFNVLSSVARFFTRKNNRNNKTENQQEYYQEEINDQQQTQRPENDNEEFRRKAEEVIREAMHAREEAVRAKEQYQKAEQRARQEQSQQVPPEQPGRTPYEILGVSPNDSDDVIKEVYKKLSNLYHPDKWQSKPSETIDNMKQKQSELNVAYNIIKKQRGFK